jgi:hypothetical protein
MKILCSVAILLLTVLLSSCGRPESRVTVTFVSCGHGPTAGDISIIKIPSGKILRDGRMSAIGSGRETFVTELAPGYYSIVAGVLPCTARRDIAVIDQKDRAVALHGQDRLDLGDGGALVGSVPTGQVSVNAACFDPVDRWLHYRADVLDGMYYFDNIRAPARCRLDSGDAAARSSNDVNVLPFKINVGPESPG